MADDVIKRLLIKLGVDRSDFDNAMKEVKRTMDTLFQAEKAKSAQRKTDSQEEVADGQKKLDLQQKVNAAVGAHIASLRQASALRGKELDVLKEDVAAERVRLDAKAQVLRVMQQQGEVQGQALRNLQQELALERSNLAVKQAQLRAAITQSSADRRQGFAGGLLEGFSSRLAGTIGFSVLSAEGLGRIFEMAFQKVKALGKALIEATGPAQTLRKEFEAIATGKGINAEDLILKLRSATRGLVDDEKLIQTSSQFLRSDAKITSEQFVNLTSNVTKLARASGHDVPAALEALGRTMQTGRGYTLAYALGLTNVRELMVQNIPAGASAATRATLGLNQTMIALEKEARKVIVPATTLPELFQQMHVQSANFIEGIATGMVHTSSFQQAITNISTKLTEMGPKLEETAKRFGEKLANAIDWVTKHTTELKMAFLGLIGLRIADWVISNGDKWRAWGNTIEWVAKKIGLVTKAEKELVAVEAAEKLVGGRTGATLPLPNTTIPTGITSTVETEAAMTEQAAFPAIAPGIGKLLSTGKGGLAYGARGAQLAGGTAVGQGELFAGLEGLGELGTINVAAGEAPPMIGAAGGVGEGIIGGALSGGTLATAGIVAAAVAAAAAVTAALMDKNKATLSEMLRGVKELGSEILETMKSVWASVVQSIKPYWDGFISWAKAKVNSLGNEISKINKLSVPSTGKTIWQIIKEQAEEALANASPLTKAIDVIIAKLKEMASIGEDRAVIEKAIAKRAAAPGITPEAKGELDRLDAERQQRLAKEKQLKEINLTLERELAQERLKIAEQEAKSRFEIIKEELDNEQTALKAKYDIGIVDLNNYLEQEKALRRKELDARLAEIETDRIQRRKEIDQQSKTVQTTETGQQVYQLEDPALTAAKKKVVDEQARVQAIQAEAQYQKQLAELLYQKLNDEIAAQKTYENAALKLRKEGLDAQTKALEDHFKSGEVGADLYIEKRKELIQAELKATLDSINVEESSSKQTEETKAKFTVERVQAQIDAEKKLSQIEEQEDSIRLQAAENRYKKELEFNTAQQQLIQYQMQTGQPGAEQRNIAVLRQAMDMDEQQLRLLTEMLGKTSEGSDEWFKIVKDIGEVNARLTEANKKLAEARDIATPLANIFEQISRLFSDSKTAKWLSDLSRGMKELADWSKKVTEQGGVQSQLKGLGSSFFSLFRGGPAPQVAKPPKTPQEIADESTKKFGKDTENAAKELEDLAKSSHGTAQQLQADWQKTVNELNTKLQSAAASLGSKLTGAMQPFIGAVHTATTALLRLAGSVPGKSGGDENKGAQQQAAGLSIPGMSSDELAQITEPSSPDLMVGQIDAPTNESGLLGTVPGMNDLSSQSSQLASIFSGLGTAANKGKSGLEQWAEKFAGFMGKFSGLVQGITGFAQAIGGAKSTGQGILSGGMSGFSTGMQLGGPIGAAIGATVGATLGGIFGHKEAIATQEAEAIKTKLDQIKASLSNNTMTIGQAIGQLQQLRATTVAEMSSGKGKGKKGQKAGLPQELQAITDEINQLLAEQKKILDDLHVQLGMLLEPTQYQDILNNLDQIIQKYQEFASAASGNAAEMAQANQWLVASLGQYATTMANNVRSANEQAISDAQKLIDLQNELNNEQLQEYDILTSGVLGRQRSMAQQKGSQIEQVEQQKQQTQSEYALQKYKVDAESKMFNLAQSRLGLEQQMVALQEKDFDLWAAQVQAMQNTLGKLQGALGPGGTLPAGLLSATGGVNIQSIEQLLGLPITATGPAGVGQPFIQNEPPIFSEFVNTIDTKTSFSQFGSQLMAAAATPFGSSQRQALLSDLSANNWEIYRALEAAGLVSKPVGGKSNDPNWLNFFGWILNQAQVVNPNVPQGSVPTPTLPSIPGLPGFQEGGTVPQDMMAMVHAGEYVIPSDVFQAFITALNNFTTTISQHMNSVRTGTGNLPGVQHVATGIAAGTYSAMMPIMQGVVSALSNGKQTLSPVSMASLPQYEQGGFVPKQGPAFLHAGEIVLPAPVVNFFAKALSGVRTGITNIGSTISNAPRPIGHPVPVDPIMLQAHKSVFDLANARIGMEHDLLIAQRQQTMLEMDRMSQMSDLLGQMYKVQGSGVQSMEGAFAKVYELRGRYGSAGFRRETL